MFSDMLGHVKAQMPLNKLVLKIVMEFSGNALAGTENNLLL